MLVRVNDISGISVRVTKLDIDDFGSVIPLREIELKLPPDDESIRETLTHSLYAIVFTEDDREDDGSTIILSRSMTTEELNEEKERTVRALEEKREDTK